MKKYDLSRCSILIPVHIDCKERMEHILFLDSYFHSHFVNHQLIILEQGREPKISLPSVKFIKSDEEFSSGIASNIGATYIKTPYFCKYDADAVIHPKAIFDAFETLKKEPEISLILPYNGISFSIQSPLREEVLKKFDFATLPFMEQEQLEDPPGMRIKNNHSTGLIHHFRTSTFKALGGYNEEFIGWGGEDDEIISRFAKLNHPRKLLENYNAFHLEHPRRQGDSVQVFKNYYRVKAVQNMPPEEILEYIKTWNRFSG